MGQQFGMSCLLLIFMVTMATCQRITEISADGRSCIVRFNDTQDGIRNVTRLTIEQIPVQSVLGQLEFRNRTRISYSAVLEKITREVIRCCDNFLNVSGVCTLIGMRPPPSENGSPTVVVIVVVAVVVLIVTLLGGAMVTFLLIRKKRDRRRSDTRKMRDFFPNRANQEDSPEYEAVEQQRSGPDPPSGADGYYSTLEDAHGGNGHSYESLASARAVAGPSSRAAMVNVGGSNERRIGTVTPPQMYDKLDPGSRGDDLYSGLVDLDRTSVEVVRDSSGYLVPGARAVDKGRAPLSASGVKGDNSFPDRQKGRLVEIRGAGKTGENHGYLVIQDDTRASTISAAYTYIDPEEKGWDLGAKKQRPHIDADSKDSYNDAASEKDSLGDDSGKTGSSSVAMGRQETYNDAISKKGSSSVAMGRQETYNDAISKKGSHNSAATRQATYNDAASKRSY